jgi:hypothetical protein
MVFNATFNNAKQLRFTIFGPHIDHDGYMSDEHVSPGLDLMFMVC